MKPGLSLDTRCFVTKPGFTIDKSGFTLVKHGFVMKPGLSTVNPSIS
jgi:hypothetical protein